MNEILGVIEVEENKGTEVAEAKNVTDCTLGEVQQKRTYSKDDARFYKFLNTIFSLCELAGYRLEGRITVTDKYTGKTYK